MFCKFSQNSQESNSHGAFFNKFGFWKLDFENVTLSLVFSCKIWKVFKAAIVQNTFMQLLLNNEKLTHIRS